MLKSYCIEHEPRRRIRGLTLIELMFAIALLVLFVTATLMDMGSIIWQQQLRSEQQQLLAAARYARQRALGSPGQWTLCMVAASQSDPSCQRHGDEGDQWLLFDDANSDDTWSPSETLAQRWTIASAQQQLFASGRASLRFSDGWRTIDSGSVLLCNRNMALGVRVIFFQSGSIRLSQDSDGDGLEDRNGTSLQCTN